jgi:cytosolic carboxypeptidase protein 6
MELALGGWNRASLQATAGRRAKSFLRSSDPDQQGPAFVASAKQDAPPQLAPPPPKPETQPQQVAAAAAASSSASAAGPPELEFDGTSFESANLASAKLVSLQPCEYDLQIRPDTLNSRHRVWFYFSVKGARAGQKVVFNILGYSKTKSLFRDGMAPVVCTSARPYWERMPPQSVFYYRSPRHNKDYVLSFPFCFERADETYYFAYCFPYTYSYLQRFLLALEHKALPCLHRELLCRSIQERRLDLLTISSPANLALDAAIRAGHAVGPPPAPEGAPPGTGPVAPRRVVLVSARVHPGESPASFMMHGLILFLTSEHARARELREHVILKVVPMLNPDGVFLGNYRCNSCGLDLNRLWHASMPGMAPTIHAVRELAQQYTAHAAHAAARGGTPAAALEMILDMHAHSTCMNGFIFANLPEDLREMDSVTAFPRCLANQAKDFSSAGCKFDRDESKAGTGRRALSEMLPGVHCYTLEVSMFCAAQGNVRGEAYQPASYTQMGHAIGLALHECYCTAKGVVLGAPALGGHAAAQHDASSAATAATATTALSGAATTAPAEAAATTAAPTVHGTAATSAFAASAFAASASTTASAGVGSAGVGSATRAAYFPARAARPMAGGTQHSAPIVRGGSAWVGAGRVGGTGSAYSSVRCASRLSNA